MTCSKGEWMAPGVLRAIQGGPQTISGIAEQLGLDYRSKYDRELIRCGLVWLEYRGAVEQKQSRAGSLWSMTETDREIPYKPGANVADAITVGGKEWMP